MRRFDRRLAARLSRQCTPRTRGLGAARAHARVGIAQPPVDEPQREVRRRRGKRRCTPPHACARPCSEPRRELRRELAIGDERERREPGRRRSTRRARRGSPRRPRVDARPSATSASIFASTTRGQLARSARQLGDERRNHRRIAQLGDATIATSAQLDVGRREPASACTSRRGLGTLRAPDRLDRGARAGADGAARAPSRSVGDHQALGGREAIRIVRRQTPRSERPRATNSARRSRAFARRHRATAAGPRPAARSPHLPAAVARERPSDVDEIVVGRQLGRRRRQWASHPEHVEHCVSKSPLPLPVTIRAPARPSRAIVSSAIATSFGSIERMRLRQAQPAVLEELAPRGLDTRGDRGQVRRASHSPDRSAAVDAAADRSPRARRRDGRTPAARGRGGEQASDQVRRQESAHRS